MRRCLWTKDLLWSVFDIWFLFSFLIPSSLESAELMQQTEDMNASLKLPRNYSGVDFVSSIFTNDFWDKIVKIVHLNLSKKANPSVKIKLTTVNEVKKFYGTLISEKNDT